jgi:hypothetical protein
MWGRRTKRKPVARRTGTQAMWIATFVGSRWYAPYCALLAGDYKSDDTDCVQRRGSSSGRRAAFWIAVLSWTGWVKVRCNAGSSTLKIWILQPQHILRISMSLASIGCLLGSHHRFPRRLAVRTALASCEDIVPRHVEHDC